MHTSSEATPSAGARALYDKLWDSHTVAVGANGRTLLYVDRHLLQEVSSPNAFADLARTGRTARRRDANLLVPDHALPTSRRDGTIADPLARDQVARLNANGRAFRLPHIPADDPRQGIVHVIGPELGFTLPGAVIVCGDSHTSTHGAFGALAFGIGTSESATVLAMQCLWQRRAPTMRITIAGQLGDWVGAKDLALALIARLGAAGARGYAVEYAGETIARMDMAARMTLCNMTIEAGARVGLIAPDETTFAYLYGRPGAPAGLLWDRAVRYWRTLTTDPTAVFARDETFDACMVEPCVTWGTSPEDALPVTGVVPRIEDAGDAETAARLERTLAYMGLRGGAPIESIPIDRVFIGSCTNGRLEDLRSAARVLRGRHVRNGVHAMVVPGSTRTKHEAEAEGLDRVFIEAGFEWRHAGCSMCVAMNDDRLQPGERCASTSNRNFEGRQGVGGRTHLMSPAMAAAAAIEGRIADVRKVVAVQ
jgi:3-isopropylmalate/(R)-2-methylmalate dehydratase large subunit